jgi:uncharacterized protein YdaU (DUF1376 family)|tara:strand:- start:172 stop:534 length:363 start_codon:yes stop_codon:yes gene_type:complete
MRKSSKIEQSPAFQFYASDWVSSPGRLKMSLEEQGAYILLYCHCWVGFQIPFDYEVLARMCNCTTDKIRKMWPNIQHMFEVKDDHIHCIQAEEERYEQELNRKRKSKAGKKGAKARWNSE